MEYIDEAFLTLADGRKLCYAEYGVRSGYPILYCHGFPASRVEARLSHATACEIGARIIAVDRPGYGGSDFLRDFRISDWPKDILVLMQALDITTFSVLGVSGGVPFAMSSAVHLRQSINKLGVVCGLGAVVENDIKTKSRFMTRWLLRRAQNQPGIVRIITRYGFSGLITNYPSLVLRLVMKNASEPDLKILRDSLVRKTLLSSLQEAFRQGGAGPAWDLYLYTNPWDFAIKDIDVETFIWHGMKDGSVPLQMGQKHATLIANAHFKVFENEGHFSLPIKHMKEILTAIMK